MLISLIGMSGSGKSYWSEKLALSGFTRFCCDDLITENLASELTGEDGKGKTLGEWMGFPYQPGYESREEIYLAAEKGVLSQILDWIDENACAGTAGNIVVDTTGSVIYTGEELLRRLRAHTTMVNFTIPPEIRESMLRQYISEPRPVLWRGHFSRKPGQSIEDALLHCYNALLDSREVLYRGLADVEIDYYTRSRPDFMLPEFLEIAAKPKTECRGVSQ